MNAHKIYLILGGARSGKSRYAEQLAAAQRPQQQTKDQWQKIYVPTATNLDEEFKTRIQIHQNRRDKDWKTIETPLNLASTIDKQSNKNTVILIDCLTMWLFNLMQEKRDPAKETTELTRALNVANGPIIMVSNEVGLSIVPENKLARHFRDAQGTLNQQIAKTSTDVVFVAAGLPLILKQTEPKEQK